jgi:hypothetical protein
MPMRRLLQLAGILLLAWPCLGQFADDNIVLVGNQAQPVQWTHQNSIQAAILRAGPKGVVWIPGTYTGTDCNPLSSCSPGTTLIIDLRGGTFQTYPVLSGAGASTPLLLTGMSLIAFTQDNFCAANLFLYGYPDYFCDLLGEPVWAPNGPTGLLQAFSFTNVAQNFTTPQGFSQVNQTAANQFAGSCAMSAGTTCTFTAGVTFTSYLSFTSIDHASAPPATAISSKCSLSGSVVTITAGASNSLTWDCLLLGNPN